MNALPLLEPYGRIAANDGHSVNIPYNNTAAANDSAIANLAATGKDHDVGDDRGQVGVTLVFLAIRLLLADVSDMMN